MCQVEVFRMDVVVGEDNETGFLENRPVVGFSRQRLRRVRRRLGEEEEARESRCGRGM